MLKNILGSYQSILGIFAILFLLGAPPNEYFLLYVLFWKLGLVIRRLEVDVWRQLGRLGLVFLGIQWPSHLLMLGLVFLLKRSLPLGAILEGRVLFGYDRVIGGVSRLIPDPIWHKVNV